jgi:hypothetical protein
MHTVWVRLNAVVFFGLTALLGFSCLAALSKLGHSLRHKPGKNEHARVAVRVGMTYYFTPYLTNIRHVRIRMFTS